MYFRSKRAWPTLLRHSHVQKVTWTAVGGWYFLVRSAGHGRSIFDSSVWSNVNPGAAETEFQEAGSSASSWQGPVWWWVFFREAEQRLGNPRKSGAETRIRCKMEGTVHSPRSANSRGNWIFWAVLGRKWRNLQLPLREMWGRFHIDKDRRQIEIWHRMLWHVFVGDQSSLQGCSVS